MTAKNESCVSVFQSGDEETLRKRLTSKWIELINWVEKDKTLGLQQNGDKPFPV